jgi:hypothetical protein
LDTNGYGGKPLIRAVLVITNDKSHPEVRFELAGFVKPRAYLSSDTARLTGPAGTEIMTTVTISPSPENPFKIKEINAEKGENIRYDLKEIKQPDALKYQLTVYNTKKEKGWYLDHIIVKTDSPKTPEFTIKIFGVIRDR